MQLHKNDLLGDVVTRAGVSGSIEKTEMKDVQSWTLDKVRSTDDNSNHLISSLLPFLCTDVLVITPTARGPRHSYTMLFSLTL